MKTVITFILLILAFPLLITAGPDTGEDVGRKVISGGGRINGLSTNYRLSGTVAQLTTGTGNSSNYFVENGFWTAGGGGCCDTPGDADNNGTVNIIDITRLIAYLYQSGIPPVCLEEGDANGDGNINILDITRLINYLYKGGAPPICP